MFLPLYLQLVLQNTHLILSQQGCRPSAFKSDDILQAKREQDNCKLFMWERFGGRGGGGESVREQRRKADLAQEILVSWIQANENSY